MESLGLALDILGVILLFVYAPEKYPHPQGSLGFKLNDADREEWERTNKGRVCVSRLGVGLIVAGFTLQLIASLTG